MSSQLDFRERLVRWTTLGFFLAGFLGGTLATILHLFEEDAHPVNLVVPGSVALVFLVLFWYTFRRPEQAYRSLWIGFCVALTALTLVTWFFTVQVLSSPDRQLVQSLPPVAPVLLPILSMTLLFMRPREVLLASTTGWVLVALPLIVYLILHPQELWTPRGMEMVIMLGPVTAVVLMLAPFFKGMERNVESLRDAHSKMRVLAERDALTNLYNRRAGEKLLRALVDAGDWSSGLIMFDIDRFKSINDTHGHAVGDSVLRRLVERCAPRLRQDDVFSRWGGEEFLVLIRGATREVLVLIAEDLRKAISRAPIDSAGTVTASFGVTPFRDGDTVDSLLGRADQALYVAKKGGRNQVVDR